MSEHKPSTNVSNPGREQKATKSIRSTKRDSKGPVIKRQKTQEADEDRNQLKYGAKFWGAYLSDRQWGTVREDQSTDFSCWDDFSHDAAVSGVYRWGEDGLMGVSDQENRFCAGLALWNGKDNILKERLFGLTNPEGNHGEDVKELYYYLCNTPDHTYMKALYRYPQSAFPYKELRESQLDRTQGEMEILDTGVFENGAFWDIYTEYSKDIPGSIMCRYTVHNRSNNESSLVLIPQMWFRNTWSVTTCNAAKPYFSCSCGDLKLHAVYELGEFNIQFGSDTEQPQILLTDNEDIFTNCDEDGQYMKDGFHQFVVHGQKSAVKMEGKGTKCCAVYKLKLPPGGEKKIYWSIYPSEKGGPENLHLYCDLVINKRKLEGESYYNGIFPASWTEEERNIAQQACAGLLWSKQFYSYDVQKHWQQIGQPSHKSTDLVKQSQSSVQDEECEEVSLKSDEGSSQENKELMLLTVKKPLPQNEGKGTETTVPKTEIDYNEEEEEDCKDKKDTRTWNPKWPHFKAHDILSVPDKWEFPWFATWDTGFQMIPFARLDAEFAKHQLLLLLSDKYMHPSGQMPGCEFNLSDMNPSVHAWACLKVYKITGSSDLDFIRNCYKRLKKNYNWMKTMTAVRGGCIYSGGFLGMDNISVVDRSHPPQGTSLEQADATGWMAMYSLNMLELSLELERYNAGTTEDALSYLSHFLNISQALNLNIQNGGLWSVTDEFYYDVLVTKMTREVIHVQSLVGLVPILACMSIKTPSCKPLFLKSLQDAYNGGSPFVWRGADDTYVLSAVPVTRLGSIVTKMFSQRQFLSPFGIRSLSKVHQDHPFEMEIKGKTFSVRYAAGESDTDMFGGNSNWRGPVWLCMNYILVEALEIHHLSTPNAISIKLDEDGKELSLEDCIQEICRRIVSLFLPDNSGHRPLHGGSRLYSCDPHWKNLVLFYEYFHGDTGRGCGASHQTGWTSLIIEFLHKVKDRSGQMSRPVDLQVKDKILK